MSILMAFTAQQTARLAGISTRMLRYWEQTAVFHPEYVRQRSSGPFRRIYSFNDLVAIRALALLRTEQHISLAELRRAGDYLRQFANQPWSSLSIRVFGDRLVFRNPETGQWTTADESGQLVMTLDLGEISQDRAAAARAMMQRNETQIGRVERNRFVMSNAWVFAGTRIPVESVQEMLAAGYDEPTVLRNYPSLSPVDLETARSFAPAKTHVA